MNPIDTILNSACGSLNEHLREPVKKKSKYRNNKKEVDGILFDSSKEANRYRQLKIRLKLGEIGLLERQVKYLLIEANGKERKCEYVADFRYYEIKTGELIIEDVKSAFTRKLPVYRIKKKLMLERYGIEILET